MSELLNEGGPAVLVKEFLVRRHLCGDRQRKKSHAVLDVGQLVVLESGEVFSGMPDIR